VTTPQSPRKPEPVAYKGEPLDAERGPGLGCFRFQMIVLVASIILTPLTVSWNWPFWITIVLFVTVMLLLLLTGQTMIFLLRLVAAGRSDGRRRPLASATPTVGEIEDEAPAESPPSPADAEAGAAPVEPAAEAGPVAEPAPAEPVADDTATTGGNDPSGVRQ